MAPTIDLRASGLVGVGHDAVATLRNAMLQDMGTNAAGYLQQAGYAGGDAVHDAFTRWLAARGEGAPDALDVASFASLASRFFAELGWGSFTFTAGTPVATIDAPDWTEAAGSSGLEQPGCHLGTGLMAAFFGRLAEQPLAVMEVECRSAGAAHCRFLVGSADEMQRIWEGMANGQDYRELIGS